MSYFDGLVNEDDAMLKTDRKDWDFSDYESHITDLEAQNAMLLESAQSFSNHITLTEGHIKRLLDQNNALHHKLKELSQ